MKPSGFTTASAAWLRPSKRSCGFPLVPAGLWARRKSLLAGAFEFTRAEKALRASVEAIDLPEVRYFVDTFVPSLKLTLDELG